MNKQRIILMVTVLALFAGVFAYFSANTVGMAGMSKEAGKIKLKKPDVIDQIVVSYNNWGYQIQNQGVYMLDAAAGGPGGEFPRGSGLTIVYSGGFWVGALKSGTGYAGGGYGNAVVSEAQPSGGGTEWYPGRITNHGAAVGPSDAGALIAENGLAADQRTYLIDFHREAVNGGTADWAVWPADAPHDASGNPGINATATAQTWSVFEDLHPAGAIILNQAGTPYPVLGLEVSFESFVFTAGVLADVVFLKFNITNASSTDLNQAYVAIYMDPDVYNNGAHDLCAVDTTLGLGMAYNAPSSTSAPFACVGLDFFQGPTVLPSDIPAASRDKLIGKFYGNKSVLKYNPTTSAFDKFVYPDSSFVLGATGFINFKSGSEKTTDSNKYKMIAGIIHGNDNNVYTNTVGLDYPYNFPGDPTAADHLTNPNLGESAAGGGADQRMLHTVGPFTLKSLATQELWVGVVGAASSSNRIAAIQSCKAKDKIAQALFDNALVAPVPPGSPEFTTSGIDGQVALSWQNNAELSTSVFQGYRVYRSLTGLSGTFTKIAEFDLADGITKVLQTQINDNGFVETTELDVGTDNGIQYSYVDKDVVNGTPYFYSVTAYDYDGTRTPASLESPISEGLTKAVPMKPLLGSFLNAQIGTIVQTSTSGILSDGTVSATVVDPSKIRTGTYAVEFFNIASDSQGHPLVGKTGGGFAYRFTFNGAPVAISSRADDASTFYDANANGTYDAGIDIKLDESTFIDNIASPSVAGSATPAIVDGMDVTVYALVPSGLLAEPNDWSIPSGTRRFTFANGDGSAGLGLEGFSGALSWDRPCHFFGGEANQYPGDQLKPVILKLAQTDASGVVTNAGDPNWSYAYRYKRGAVPNYGLQEYAQTMPMSAWDVSNPSSPRRLELGYLENAGGPPLYVDGKYWPPFYADVANNVGSTSPREWLFISDQTYSTTADPGALSGPALTTADQPYMFLATWCRRAAVAWSPGASGDDQFEIFVTKPLTAAHKFSWTGKADSVVTGKSALKSNLNNIKVVPNPYYGRSTYQSSLFDKKVKFTNLPASCTIRIFTVSGDLVSTIVHNGTSNNDRLNTDPLNLTSVPTSASTSTESWDLKNFGLKYVASGMYVALVDAPGIGKKAVKFAIIQEEVLIPGFDLR